MQLLEVRTVNKIVMIVSYKLKNYVDFYCWTKILSTQILRVILCAFCGGNKILTTNISFCFNPAI